MGHISWVEDFWNKRKRRDTQKIKGVCTVKMEERGAQEGSENKIGKRMLSNAGGSRARLHQECRMIMTGTTPRNVGGPWPRYSKLSGKAKKTKRFFLPRLRADAEKRGGVQE